MTYALEFIKDGSTPGTPEGNEEVFIVAVRRAHDGNVYTFPASYLNSFPLQYEDEPYERETTGWFYPEGDGDNDRTYIALLGPSDRLEAWAKIPKYKA